MDGKRVSVMRGVRVGTRLEVGGRVRFTVGDLLGVKVLEGVIVRLAVAVGEGPAVRVEV